MIQFMLLKDVNVYKARMCDHMDGQVGFSGHSRKTWGQFILSMNVTSLILKIFTDFQIFTPS